MQVCQLLLECNSTADTSSSSSLLNAAPHSSATAHCTALCTQWALSSMDLLQLVRGVLLQASSTAQHSTNSSKSSSSSSSSGSSSWSAAVERAGSSSSSGFALRAASAPALALWSIAVAAVGRTHARQQQQQQQHSRRQQRQAAVNSNSSSSSDVLLQFAVQMFTVPLLLERLGAATAAAFLQQPSATISTTSTSTDGSVSTASSSSGTAAEASVVLAGSLQALAAAGDAVFVLLPQSPLRGCSSTALLAGNVIDISLKQPTGTLIHHYTTSTFCDKCVFSWLTGTLRTLTA
jgi:hypothetical protein